VDQKKNEAAGKNFILIAYSLGKKLKGYYTPFGSKPIKYLRMVHL